MKVITPILVILLMVGVVWAEDELRLLSDNTGCARGTNIGCKYTLSKPPDYWNKPLTGRELLDGTANSTGDSIAWRKNAIVDIDFELPAVFPIETVKLLMCHFTGAYRIRSFEVYLATEPGRFGEAVSQVGDLLGLGQGPHELTARIGGKPARWVRVRAHGGGLMVIGEVEIWGRASDEELCRTRASSGVLKFDFGPANSVTPTAFALVTEKTSLDQQKGYGWVNTERIGSLFNGLPDSIFGTLTWGGQDDPGRFRVAVNPGRYRVFAFLGDVHELAAYQWQEVRIGGQTARIEHAPPPASNKRFDKRWPMLRVAEMNVNVTEPYIVVEVCGSPCWSLCGLVIARDEKADTAAAELHDILQEERRVLGKFVLTPHERETHPAVSPTGDETKRGYLAFGHPYTLRVFPETMPPEGRPRKASAAATPGEHEPITFSVRALRPIFGMKVLVTDLSASSGSRIPASSMKIHSVRLWPQRSKASWGKEYDIVHEVLDPHDQGINIPPGVTREFWMTLHAPADAAPGTYTGKLTMTAENAPSLDLPIEVRILPFKLDELKERVTGVYFKYPPTPKQDVEKLLADIRDHGVRAVTMSFQPAVKVRDDKLEIDFSRSDEFVSLLKKYGITGPMPFHPPRPKGKYVECVRAMLDHARQKGWPEVLFYPVDEPGNSQKRRDECLKLLQLIKQVPGAVTYVTCNGKVEDYVPKIDPWMDVRCYQMLSYTRKQQEDTLAKGDRLYFYYGPIGDDAKRARLVNGFFFWRTGATALYYWHHQYVCGSPNTDFDSRARDWCAVYPGPSGPLSTVAWEGVREGIDDLRYIELLKKTMSESKDADAVAEAKRALEGIKQAIDPEGPNFKDTLKAMKSGQMDRFRADIVRCICRLKGLKAE